MNYNPQWVELLLEHAAQHGVESAASTFGHVSAEQVAQLQCEHAYAQRWRDLVTALLDLASEPTRLAKLSKKDAAMLRKRASKEEAKLRKRKNRTKADVKLADALGKHRRTLEAHSHRLSKAERRG